MFNTLNFDYLVVDGAKAQFKGSGKISNQYGTIQSGIYFMMTVIDGKLIGTGVPDRIHMKIYNKSTGQVYYDNQPGAGSDWDDPTTVIDQGGDITIVNPNMVVGTPTTMALVTERQEMKPASRLSIAAYPNPSENQFTLKIESDNLKDRISIRVFDMAGRTIQTFTNLAPGQTVKVGWNYKVGVYFIDMMQGDRHKQIKLVKQ
jgi:hypothetical protein